MTLNLPIKLACLMVFSPSLALASGVACVGAVDEAVTSAVKLSPDPISDAVDRVWSSSRLGGSATAAAQEPPFPGDSPEVAVGLLGSEERGLVIVFPSAADAVAHSGLGTRAKESAGAATVILATAPGNFARFSSGFFAEMARLIGGAVRPVSEAGLIIEAARRFVLGPDHTVFHTARVVEALRGMTARHEATLASLANVRDLGVPALSDQASLLVGQRVFGLYRRPTDRGHASIGRFAGRVLAVVPGRDDRRGSPLPSRFPQPSLVIDVGDRNAASGAPKPLFVNQSEILALAQATRP